MAEEHTHILVCFLHTSQLGEFFFQTSRLLCVSNSGAVVGYCLAVQTLQLDQTSTQQWISEIQRLVSSITCEDYDGFSLFIRTITVPVLKAVSPQNSTFVSSMLASFIQHVDTVLTRSWAAVVASRGPESASCDEDESDDDETDINDDSERRLLSGSVAALLNSITRNSLVTENPPVNQAVLHCACDALFWYDSRVVHHVNEVLFALVTRPHSSITIQVLSSVFQKIITHALQRGSAPSLLPSWPDSNLVKTTLFIYQTLMSASPAEFRAYLVSSQCVPSTEVIDVCFHLFFYFLFFPHLFHHVFNPANRNLKVN